MYKELLSALKKTIWAICFSALLITAGLIFHWFYVLAAGVIIAISVVFYIIAELKYGDGDESIATGCLLTILFVIAAFFYRGERYISPHGHKQHLYSDCPSIIGSSSVKEVNELEGFFYLTFSDCKICKERRKIEHDNKIAAEKQYERDELRDYLNNLIDSLDHGADPKDIKLQLQDDWGSFEEDEESYPDQP